MKYLNFFFLSRKARKQKIKSNLQRIKTTENNNSTENAAATNNEGPKVLYYTIPVEYEIRGNFLSYLKFRRALARTKKVINFDREEIKVVEGGGINSIGTLSIVGLPDEYK